MIVSVLGDVNSQLSKIESTNVCDIITWQMTIYKKQILLFNTVLLVVNGAIAEDDETLSVA